jgi:hypothetical protein
MHQPAFMTSKDSHGAPSALDAGDAWVLALLVGAFLASRLAWLHWNPDSSGYWEESYRWVIASEIATGRVQPFFEYQADHYQGGSLVMSLLTVPFFKLIGQSMFSLKLSALTLSTGILTMVYLLGRKFFGRPVGLLVGLAYLAGPPLVAYIGLLVMGTHGESILFSLLQIFLFLGILSGPWRRPWGWTVFGLVSGFGIWFCYTTGLSLAACALTWMLLRRSPPRPKECLWATAGGLAGFAPWFVYNFQYGFVGGLRILEMFGFGDPIDPWVSQSVATKLVNLLARDLLVGLLSPFPYVLSPFLSKVIAAAFCLPLALALAISAARVAAIFRQKASSGVFSEGLEDMKARERELVFLVYGLVFLIVFLLSSFTVDPDTGVWAYRLFTPPAVILMLPAAITAERGFRRGRWLRGLTSIGCGLALIAMSASTVALTTRKADFNQSLSPFRGYKFMGVLLHRKFENDLKRALLTADRVPNFRLREEILKGIGWGMEFRFEKQGTLEEMGQQLASIPSVERAGILKGMRWALNMRRQELRMKAARGKSGGRYFGTIYRLDSLSELVDEETKGH